LEEGVIEPEDAATANVGIIARDPSNPEAEEEVDLDLASEDPTDDPDDTPLTWAAPAA
jgi:hypothetical protein